MLLHDRAVLKCLLEHFDLVDERVQRYLRQVQAQLIKRGALEG